MQGAVPRVTVMGMLEPARRGRYHHGDLRTALIDAAIDLLAERGVAGFSLAEVSRRLGVTAGAPYNHFADREELLAAVGVRAFEALTAAIGEGAAQASVPAEQLAASARSYIEFAAGHRPLFDALFGGGLDKGRHPELAAAAQLLAEAFIGPARTICDGDKGAAEELALAVAATAHGHATFLLFDEASGPDADAVAVAAARAARVTLALVAAARPLSPG